MARGPWLGVWFKVFNNFDEVDENGNPKFWTGKIDNDELGAWIRLISLGSRMKPKGIIQAGAGLPFTPEQVNFIIKTEKKYLTKWEKQGAIKTEKGVIYIVNWKLYQNEQDRKDSYKDPLNRPPKQTQRERDRDVEVKEEKTTTKDSRVKILIDYFFQAHQTAGKGKIHICGGKDGQKMIDLLKTFSEQEIKNRIDLFMKYNDPWMKDKPYSIGMFSSQFNKLKGEITIRTNGLPSADEVDT